jgi:tRNA-uridine 2-sulfurtransferase
VKILLGLSGGVDSAVAAYLLKAQGHQVECAFMRNWDSLTNNDILGNPTLDQAVCTQESDYADALSVATKLNLPLHRVDFITEYWDEVFTTFLTDYQKGRTPNPDILCNKHIKFKHFFEYADRNGFDWVATGHYAKVIHHTTHSELHKADDTNKDQTYFLAQVPPHALRTTLFPLGDIPKPLVRKIASELGLSIAAKKDSTGICFIGERDFQAFLANYLPAKTGPIIDLDTLKLVGTHQGILYYTLGQRKGLDIHAHQGPWFVAGKDLLSNTLYVVKGETNPWLFSDSARITDLNWFNPIDLSQPKSVMAKFRYRQPDQPVTVHRLSEHDVMVHFHHPISAVTPGQEAVFYDGTLCLGGGTIEDVLVNGISLKERIAAHVCTLQPTHR